MKLIAIDPYRSLTAEKCTQHIAPLPGTATLLAGGLPLVPALETAGASGRLQAGEATIPRTQLVFGATYTLDG